MQFLVIHDSGKSQAHAKAHSELQRQRDHLLTSKHPKKNAAGRLVCLYQANSKEQLAEWLRKMKLNYEKIELYNNDAASPDAHRHGSA